MKKEPEIWNVINLAMIALAIIAGFMQFIIDDSTDNIASTCIVLVASLSTLAYFRYSTAFETHPISTFAIFGFCATTQYGALLVQSASWNSVSRYLRQPVETFAWLLLFLLIAIAAHMTFRLVSVTGSRPQPARSEFGLRRLLEKAGLYTIPTVHQLWIIGLIGMIAIFSTGKGEDGQNIASKISGGISFLAWAPFLIPMFVAQVGKQYCNTKVHYSLLIAFSGFLALIGIASNARFMIVSGATTVGLFILLIGMRSKLPASNKQIFQAVVLLALCAAMLIPVSQLSTAMVAVRGHRASSSALSMIYATIDVLQKPQVIEAQGKKEKFAAWIKPYDEYYIENPVLARFINTKFQDNSLYFESKLSEHGQDELTGMTIDLLWSIFPDPVLNYLDVKIRKKSLKFSMGDYLYYQATGDGLGGYRVGSSFAHGLGMFGMLFPLIYFGICLLTYWVLEFLSNKTEKGTVLISVVGSLEIWHLFISGITSESLNGTVGFLFREIPQSILIYLIFFHLARFGSYLLTMVNQLHPAKVYTGKAK